VDKRRHTDVIRDAVTLAGRRTVDIGCGGGALLGWLERQEARALGVDLQLDAVRRARAAGLAVAVARADALPLADGGVDVAIIFNSLHHFPDPASALAEARRVLRADGVLYVAEPLAEGPYFTFMQPVDDEPVERGQALDALADAERGGLRVVCQDDYEHDVVVIDLDSEISAWLTVDPTRGPRVDAVRDELKRRLEALATRTPKGHILAQPMRSWVLRTA